MGQEKIPPHLRVEPVGLLALDWHQLARQMISTGRYLTTCQWRYDDTPARQ